MFIYINLVCPQYKLDVYNINGLLCSILLMASYEVSPHHTDICCATILRLVISLQARYQLQELKKLSSTDNKFKALRDATKRYRIYNAIVTSCYCVFGRHSLPCVPYLGPMLNELCILFEVSPTYLQPTDDSQKLVNFNKMRQVHSETCIRKCLIRCCLPVCGNISIVFYLI